MVFTVRNGRKKSTFNKKLKVRLFKYFFCWDIITRHFLQNISYLLNKVDWEIGLTHLKYNKMKIENISDVNNVLRLNRLEVLCGNIFHFVSLISQFDLFIRDFNPKKYTKFFLILTQWSIIRKVFNASLCFSYYVRYSNVPEEILFLDNKLYVVSAKISVLVCLDIFLSVPH